MYSVRFERQRMRDDARKTTDSKDLKDLVKRMRGVSQRVYGLFFASNMGAECHAFLEFNGLLSKYVDICEAAINEGVDFRTASIHGGTGLPLAGHDVEYLAEKFTCIFGPAFRAQPALWGTFVRTVQDRMEGRKCKTQ